MRNSFLPATAAAVAFALLLGGQPLESAEQTASEIDALKQRVAELEAQVAQLVSVNSARETPQDAVSATPLAGTSAPRPEAGSAGFGLSTTDRSWRLRIRATAQADARFIHGAGTDTFLLRRLCPSFEGTVGSFVGFKFMPDLAPSTPVIRDAYMDVTLRRGLQLRVGKSKVPFDLERLASQSELLFVERAHTTSLAPDRDIGLLLLGNLADGRLEWAAGIYNGVTDGGSSTTDGDETKDFVARSFWRPWLDAKGKARPSGVGISVSTGQRDGVTPSGYRTLAQQSMFAFRSGVVAQGTHWRISPQGCFYAGSFGAMASWALSSQELALASAQDTVESRAWQAAASWVLTGEDASPRGVSPARSFDPQRGGWGAFELTARVSGLETDRDAFPVFANPTTAVRKTLGGTIGMNWYWNGNVKAVANYECATFSGGAANDGDRRSEHALLTRFQLRY